MKTITRDQKRSAIYAYYMTQDKSTLCSLILSLLYPNDIDVEYRHLPKEFKVK